MFRHHADNVEQRSVHADRAVYHAGIVRKMLGPGPMAEDKDRRAARFVVQRCEGTPAHGADTEYLEEIPRDERALQPAALNPGIQLSGCRECLREDARFADERFILRARIGFALRVGRTRSLDCEQLVRVSYLVDAKDV